MTSLSALPAYSPSHGNKSIRLRATTVDAPADLDWVNLAPSRGAALCWWIATRLLLYWIIPAALLIAATLLFTKGGGDIAVSRLFYGGGDNEEDWAGSYAEPWHLLYRVGPAPGLVLGIAGGVVGVCSFVVPKWRRHRTPGLFLAALLVIGPGFLVNGVLKPSWGRPRPCQIVEFGGKLDYLPCWQSSVGPRARSFPSGHASMGFYLVAPAFFLCYSNRRAALGFVILGLTVGGSIGLARIVQGRHFPSDVLWSLGCVYFCGLVLSTVLMRKFQGAQQHQPALSVAGSQFDERFPATISIEAARAAEAQPERQQRIVAAGAERRAA